MIKSTTLILAILLLGCNKLDIQKGTPKSIKSKIKDFNKSQECEDRNVKEYTFQGNTVYAFDPGLCGADLTTEIVNSDSDNLGYLGGISGNYRINGEEFSNAIFIKTTWEN
jgi:hypothetical protein